MDVIIPAFWPFSVQEFIDFGFQDSIWNPEFVRESYLRWFICFCLQTFNRRVAICFKGLSESLVVYGI